MLRMDIREDYISEYINSFVSRDFSYLRPSQLDLADVDQRFRNYFFDETKKPHNRGRMLEKMSEFSQPFFLRSPRNTYNAGAFACIE